MSSYRGPYGDLSDSDKADLESFHPDACPECGRRRCDCLVEVESEEDEPEGPRLTLSGDPNVTPRPFAGFEPLEIAAREA